MLQTESFGVRISPQSDVHAGGAFGDHDGPIRKIGDFVEPVSGSGLVHRGDGVLSGCPFFFMA